MRFVGSALDNEGRVEFCQGGVWRVFCLGGINPASATVVCRKFGHDPIGGKDVPSTLDYKVLFFSALCRWLPASDFGWK